MRIATLSAIALAAVAPLQAQSGGTFDSAYAAWRAGDYPTALVQLERLLESQATPDMIERIGELTGEVFRTTELAPDGTQPVWSPQGRFAAFQTGQGTQLQVHVLVMTPPAAGRQTLVAGGFNPAFSGDGRVAIMGIVRPAELERRLEELRQGVRSFQDFQRFRRAAERMQAEHTVLRVVNLMTGESTRPIELQLALYDAHFGPDGTLFVAATARGSDGGTDIYALRERAPERLTSGPGMKRSPRAVLDGSHIAYRTDDGVAVLNLASRAVHSIAGTSPAISADGRVLAYVTREGDTTSIVVRALTPDGTPAVLARTTSDVANLAVSAGGARVVWQQMDREDWELWVAEAGRAPRRLTHEIQHDLFPRFLTEDVILAVMGEGRHRRSYLYEFATGKRMRLFHNNTIRTVAPEYEWAASPDGSQVIIVSERDGDTISPERGVYLVDLRDRVGVDAVLRRIRTMRAGEAALRAAGTRMFEPVEGEVRAAVRDVSTERIYGYAADLYAFGSKWIAAPGNARAIEYLTAKLRSFGYEPELQWFEARGQRTANVIATLRGTAHPDVTYVVSSHFDSVNDGPGADDNSSGTTALLEAARVLARRPQPATIQFAFFTGEEAGLLGSREFVRRAVERRVQLVGALNNDMIGYANDERLDNTIRYSNAGLRDLQHGAALQFTDLILYDAKYYKSTDAHAYYDAYGDIVGGIGSYPILGNPHYHQEHDVLETISQQLVAEVSKTTVASIMLMASSPSRLTGLEMTRARDGWRATWKPAVENDVIRYRVTWGPPDGPLTGTREVTATTVDLGHIPAGTVVRVKAVNRRGLESWDWTQASVGR